jgi:hypothetical protein
VTARPVGFLESPFWSRRGARHFRRYATGVIVLGIICVLIGVLVPSRFLWIAGSVLVFVGIVLLILNLLGRGRRYY